MFDTNISYSDTNESEMILGNKIAAYGDAKRYIDSFRKDDYALFYSKGRGIIAVGQIVTDTPTEVGDEKYHSVRMIVPENFNGDVKALPALSPNEIKTILKRNFYWASTIKTPFLTGVQVQRCPIAGFQKLLLPMPAIPPARTDCMDHIFAGQAVSLCNFCTAGFAAMQRTAFCKQFRSGRTMNAAIHTAAAQKGRVGSIDDCVNVHFCNIVSDHLQRHEAPLPFVQQLKINISK